MNNHSNPHTTYARVAGLAFLFYIVAGIASLSLGSGAPIVNLLYFLLGTGHASGKIVVKMV